MHIAPQIAAMKRDRQVQHRAQARIMAALDEWRMREAVRPVLADLKAYGEGRPLADGPALARVLTDHGHAAALAGGFTTQLVRALRDQPLAQVPLRHSCSEGSAVIQLAASGRARLFLVAREAGGEAAAHASFPDRERHDLVLSGEATARLVSRRGAELATREASLCTGTSLALDCHAQALVLQDVTRRMISLRLERDAEAPRPTTLVDIASGEVLHRAQGSKLVSRKEMMLALLGRMERADAAPVMAQQALGDGPAELRWQALRELLALDSGTGFAALTSLSRRTGDSLAKHADSLRTALLARHPLIAAKEAQECPA
ncbi:hypothetical protein [Paraurantiacibacter namhicola]|uniref:Uncharacterized protein n=1 Tax=Paraurantiacibacter namhicola TaxID=645517 RepID=A0A1C7D7V6_9SPHN|nr:hypothetical protein [Paraurantiacibacter namhicola]ANU07401.1 hypothetical protein A6F65_01093 [Paraurantiacibacter namhicola]